MNTIETKTTKYVILEEFEFAEVGVEENRKRR